MYEKGVFTAEQFTPTQWDTAAQKAKFANHFLDFVESGFPASKFPKWFYTRLSMTFGHIAHFNREGFYETFFTTPQDKVRFLEFTLQAGCHGDPAFIYSDVEKALKAYLEKVSALSMYQKIARAEQEKAERATLAALKAKYEPRKEIEHG